VEAGNHKFSGKSGIKKKKREGKKEESERGK